jgi:predicted DNA-binding protein
MKRMSQKVGRPQADNPKDIRYSIRLDSITEERLKEYCEKHSISKGEAIRQGIELLLASDN